MPHPTHTGPLADTLARLARLQAEVNAKLPAAKTRVDRYIHKAERLIRDINSPQ